MSENYQSSSSETGSYESDSNASDAPYFVGVQDMSVYPINSGVPELYARYRIEASPMEHRTYDTNLVDTHTSIPQTAIGLESFLIDYTGTLGLESQIMQYNRAGIESKAQLADYNHGGVDGLESLLAGSDPVSRARRAYEFDIDDHGDPIYGGMSCKKCGGGKTSCVCSPKHN